MRLFGKSAGGPITIFVVVTIAAVALWWNERGERPSLPRTEPTKEVANSLSDGTVEAPDRIKRTASVLVTNTGGDAARRSLEELKSYLAGLPHQAAASATLNVLRSGVDAPTGLTFTIGPGGMLSASPSLRVFLLDYLAQLDPASAAEFSRAVLASKDSPDEWAVALRCIARANTDEATRNYLAQKMRELLTHEPWRIGASTGFLESFDVAVYLRGASLVPELATLVRLTDNRAVAHAAYLAMDRLSIIDAAPVLTKLVDEPELMQGREVTRANYFARADVTDGAQRATLERYLLDPRRSAEELRTFTGLYPNANLMVSENLLTLTITPDRGTLVARDQAALRAVNEWLADARFTALRSELERARVRLERFLKQAAQ
jgi:hypothetical protein